MKFLIIGSGGTRGILAGFRFRIGFGFGFGIGRRGILVSTDETMVFIEIRENRSTEWRVVLITWGVI
jgi:hypothetical protein